MDNSCSSSQLRNGENKVFRSPQRISITLPYGIYQKLLERSDLEGRSLSNLSAFLLESAIEVRQDRAMNFI